MTPNKSTLRKDMEKKRANVPVRPLAALASVEKKKSKPKPMTVGRWVAILVVLAVLGWCAGWGVSVYLAPPEMHITSLDNLPTKARAHSINTYGGIPAVGDDSAEKKDAASALADKAFQTGPYRSGELVFRAGSAEELAALVARAQAAGGVLLGAIRQVNAVRFSFPNAASMTQFLRGNAGDEPVPGADLNYTVSLPTTPAPTDPYAPGSLQPFGTMALAYMGVPQDNANWGQGVTVAMLDTGLSPGTTNILKGGAVTQYDMTGASDTPALGHGDMVASLLAGANGEQGIVPGSPIMSVRVLDSNDQGDVFGVSDGIYTAVDGGAKVLSLSLGSSQSSDILQAAVDYAISQGVVVVASAGNDGNGAIDYPAAYPGVVAVGSVDATGQRATFSDYGPQLDLMAPGVGLTTVTTGGNMSFSGTSASAPLVAGAIASLLSSNPSMTGEQAVDMLTQYADFAGPVTGNATNEFYGAGTVDLGRVLNRNDAIFTDAAVADMYLDVTTMPTTPTVPLQVSVQNRGNTELGLVNVNISYGGQAITQSLVGMAPNEVRAITVDLPVAQLVQPNGLQVDAQVSTNNDDNLLNNGKARLIHLTPAGG